MNYFSPLKDFNHFVKTWTIFFVTVTVTSDLVNKFKSESTIFIFENVKMENEKRLYNLFCSNNLFYASYDIIVIILKFVL